MIEAIQGETLSLQAMFQAWRVYTPCPTITLGGQQRYWQFHLACLPASGKPPLL